MPKKYNTLTKSKITSGLQCHKKLWFDIHQPIRENKAAFKRGFRFEDEVRKIYAKSQKVLDLSPEKIKWIKPKDRTEQAIYSKDTNVIFEGAFEYLNTLVRTDVLIRKKKGWELLEVKSSTKLKPEHIKDISIQSFIVKKCMKQLGHDLITIKLIHINKNFTLKKEGKYEGLIDDEIDITKEINEEEIPNYIKDLITFTKKDSPCPNIKMGSHCKKPYDCNYIDRCKSLETKKNITSYKILPWCPAELKKYCEEKKIVDLQKVPVKYLLSNRKGFAKNYHKKIQESHKNNKPYFSENLKNIFKDFSFPFYFMDFEHINQGVPIIKGTQPYFRLPFQWSVHKWESIDKEIDKGKSFLKFKDQDIERKFIEGLLEAVGENGTIFAHSANTVEISILNELKKKDNCKDLLDKIDKLIKRTIDTYILVGENFYHPLMNGDYGIKSIIKAIPNDISYEEKDNIAGGDEAQLAWFIYTDPKTPNKEKDRQKELLIDYCSKDTLAVYYLVKYLMKNSKIKNS